MFSGKVVLITGASSGIGAETAREFSRLGASLVLTGRNKENLEMVSKNCEEISSNKFVPLKIIADIKNEKDVENIIETTIKHFKKLDVLVNNAGIAASGPIETTSLHQFDDIMQTNVRAPYYLLTTNYYRYRTTVLMMLDTPYLIRRKGNIVNVSSVGGLRAFPDFLAYCISKAALDQFTRSVALELAPKGVRVNSVNPGDMITGIHLKGSVSEHQYKAYLEKCKTIHPLGRIGKPNEVSPSFDYPKLRNHFISTYLSNII